MAPKKKGAKAAAKPKAKAGSKTAVVNVRGPAKALASVSTAADSPRSQPVAVLGGYNADLIVKAQKAFEEVLQVDTFARGALLPAEDIKVVEEGSGENCSYITPFVLMQCRTALRHNGKYDCGFNLLKLKKLVQSTSRGGPVRQESVDAFERFHLSEDPRTLTLEHKLWCRVDTSVDLDKITMKQIADLDIVSPEEPRFALAFKMHKDREDIEKATGWVRVARQTTVRFIYFPLASLWSLQTTLRETVAQDFVVMARTPLQFVFEVAVFVEELERRFGKQSPAQVHMAMFKAQKEGTLKCSDLNSHVKTENSINDSLIVWRRALSQPEILTSCMNAENKGNSFWTDLGKLFKTTQRCSDDGMDKEFVVFCFKLINHMHSIDAISSSLGVRDIPDLVKRMHLKYKIKNMLRGSWLDCKPMSPENKALIRRATDDVNTWISKCGSNPGVNEKIDLTWQSVFC